MKKKVNNFIKESAKYNFVLLFCILNQKVLQHEGKKKNIFSVSNF